KVKRDSALDRSRFQRRGPLTGLDYRCHSILLRCFKRSIRCVLRDCAGRDPSDVGIEQDKNGIPYVSALLFWGPIVNVPFHYPFPPIAFLAFLVGGHIPSGSSNPVETYHPLFGLR